MVTSPFRQASFPGKYCPWNLKEHRSLDVPINALYKHHLHLLPSNSNAALYMPPDTGGMGLARLSDQIIIDKWAMLWRGLHADLSTRTATDGLLYRALRLGHTNTDPGIRSTIVPSKIPQLLTGLIELTSSLGISLCKGGSCPRNTPDQTIAQALHLSLHSKLDKKLMNLRISTLSDLMIFAPNQTNSWALPLIHSQLPLVQELLPPDAPAGDRSIRIGQFWSLEDEGGLNGYILEILGVLPNGLINIRKWIPLIPRATWIPDNIALHRRRARDKIWVHPAVPGISRGAGSTDTISPSSFRGRILRATLGQEEPITYLDDGQIPRKDIARQVFFCAEERLPSMPKHHNRAGASQDPIPQQFLQDCTNGPVDVFVDGSMRFPATALDHAFPQPKSHQVASYAQGGILILPIAAPSAPVSERNNDYSIITRSGPILGLCSPSSIELYTIILAIHCMESAQLTGTVYTDYQKAARVANNPSLLHSMGREGDLPLFQYLIMQLNRNPRIRLEHVKAHGDIKKCQKWSRPQWGNYYADLIAKNQESAFSVNHHTEMDLLPLEQLVRTHSSWHWLRANGHLVLEPLPQVIRRGTHLTYMRDRDSYRAHRGEQPKWQYAKVGLLNDLWKLNNSSLRAKAYAHRMVYDKGWHGGNRGKTAAPTTHTQEEWTACGLCGLQDSQHHWIRECKHPPVEALRRHAEAQVSDIIMELRVPTIKRTKRDPDLIHMAETLQGFASAAVHGEHLWLGVIYTNMIHHLQQHGLDFEFTTTKPCPRSNRWKQLVLKIIKPLLAAATAMWQIKEDSRRETLLGVPTAAERVSLARQKKHQGDIRKWFRRVQHKVGSLQHLTEDRLDIDHSDTADLLAETPTVPLHTTRLRRTATPTPAPPPPPAVRWRTTTIQDFFPLTRDNSKKMIAKNPLPNGQLPFLRRLRLDSDMDLDLSWLPPKETEEMERGPGSETAEALNIVDRSWNSSSSSSSGSSSSSSSSNSSSNLFSSIGSNNFIFRVSDSRSSLCNEGVDDSTKRRGVG
jgi:hypothetical protein